MTGLTDQEFEVLLPHFEHAWWSICRTAPLRGNPAHAAATVPMMTIVPYPRASWRPQASLLGMAALRGAIYRPIDPEAQQDHDSCKKKCHTIKKLLVIDQACHICFLSDTVEGKAHDKSLADLAADTLPRGSHLNQEPGFQGVMIDGITIVQPTKKPRGGELPPPENAYHRVITSIGIGIEHAIGGVKRYQMVKNTIRLLKDGIRHPIMETCSGLHNIRLQYQPWNYAT